jgi:hypothetical protein
MGEVEAWLQQHSPQYWSQLTPPQLNALLGPFVAGWRVTIPAGTLRIDGIAHLDVALDAAYPSSQMRVFAPGAGNDFRWPHVEGWERLCLRPTRIFAPHADRFATHLNDAIELLRFSESKCRREFEREFLSYWSQRAEGSSPEARVWSLLKPGGSSREIWAFFDSRTGRYVVADEKATLRKWLRNSGANPSDSYIFPTWLFRLSRPWIPKDFPKRGSDVTSMLAPETLQRCLRPGLVVPLLFEAETETGAAFVAVTLHGGSKRELEKGFRHISRVPLDRIIGSYASRSVARHRVIRVDGAWIHGRDHASSFAEVRDRKVVLIGCGAIGASVARLLAQAGVGELVFVDHDTLSAPNTARHVLGSPQIGVNKATGLQAELRRQFPHLTFDHAFPERFERLSKFDKRHIADADLVVSAGIDVDGEGALDNWRQSLTKPPAYLSCWAESFAVAGHAVLLFGQRSLMSTFDEQERPTFRLTDWPDEVATVIVEAGCGNSFQPHGVIDLQPTVVMAAGIALACLRGQVPSSCRRVWMGDRATVEGLGGVCTPLFANSFCVQEYAWP